MAYGSRGFVVYDVSDPQRPIELNLFQPDSMRIYEIDIINDLGYLSDYQHAFHVLDLKDPADPKLIDSFRTDRVIYKSFRQGDYIYLAAARNGMFILQFN